MSFKLGNTSIGELYVGSNKIAQAYLGSNLVYQASGPTPPGPVGDEVTIGTQTWKTQDLSGTDGGEDIYTPDNVRYYYTLQAAQRMAPNGWHVPTSAEFDTLLNYIGTNACQKLKATSGWLDKAESDGGETGNGTDEYGFHGAPVGTYLYSQYTINGVGEYVYYITTTTGRNMYWQNVIYTLLLDRSDDGARVAQSTYGNYYAVRLIKD